MSHFEDMNILELARALPPLITETAPDLSTAVENGYVEYNVTDGIALRRELLNRARVIVVEEILMMAGSKFTHTHSEREIDFLWQGVARIEYNGNVLELQAGDMVQIEADTEHSGEVLETARMIVIKVPG